MFLPLSGLDELADFALHQVALEGADVADVELAVEVVGFVEEGAGEQVFSGFFVPFAVDVLSADGDFLGAGDGLAEVGNAEAAFGLGLLALFVDDFRIGEDELGVGIFFEADVDDGEALGDSDLRGGEADAVGLVHGLEHVGDELFKFAVEGGDGFGWSFQHEVSVFDDGIDHAVCLKFSCVPPDF
jgi:hypothetical protein